MTGTRKVTTCGLLVAAAMILSWVESQIPAFFAVPGMKLGLTNAVVLTALYLLGNRAAMLINIIRILLVSAMFGSAVSLAYSLAGGMLSTAVMILLRKTGRFHIVTVSAAGGITHNIGQIVTAMVLLGTGAIAWYLPVLWFTGLATGALIGLIGGEVLKRLLPEKDRKEQ